VASTLNPMTPHGNELKHEVGLRELRDSLSRYVEHVARGEEVVVTVRGRRVARLAPIESEDPLADLRRRGLVREPSAPKRPAAEHRMRGQRRVTVSDLVAEQRR